jgi:hypothetical protein
MTDKMDYRDYPHPIAKPLQPFQDPQFQALVEKTRLACFNAMKAIDEEIAKLDVQIKRYKGFWGFWRFCWDDMRGKAK